MRVFISVDMEGIGGIVSAAECDPEHPEHQRARRLMTDETNAAIAGAFAGGAGEVLVNDSHDGMENLLPELLDRRAVALRGRLKPLSMVQGLDAGHAAALLVGYHARAGTRDAVLAHTMSGPRIQEVRLNGEPAGEILLNASYAAALGVPVVLVTGDEAACREAETAVPGVRTVAVKRAAGSFAAAALHPAAAQAAVAAEAEAAVRAASGATALEAGDLYRLEVRFGSPAVAQWILRIPGLEDVDSRTVAFTSTSMRDVYTLFDVMVDLAAAAGRHGHL